MAATLLLVGDIHLGRRPGGLPDDLEQGWGVSPSRLTPAAAWRATVDLALRERVDAVVLAGDVVEADNARFEAFGRLEQGVQRLVHEGIGVWAVAGNHDVEALPRLADLIPGFRLLGRGGRWELAPVSRDGETLLHLLGWSFPARRHPTTPLQPGSLPPPPGDGLPVIGVMHCDLEGSGSSYAPVGRAELERAGADAWFLGHVHKPSDLSGARPRGYLGSLVGLDPTETGTHGPWVLKVGAGAGLTVEQVPLAPLRWEEVELDVSELGGPDELLPALLGSLDALRQRLAGSLGDALAVGCRVRLTGSSPRHRELRAEWERAEPEALRRGHDGIVYFVQKVVDDSKPAIDLERLATGDDPPALLARRLLELSRGEAAPLLRRARRDLEAVAEEPWWRHLGLAGLDDDRTRELVFRAGLRALEELLQQAPPRAEADGE